MPSDQMIVLRNEYPDEIIIAEEKPKTSIEPIEAKDIIEGDYHKINKEIVNGKTFLNFMEKPTLLSLPFVLSAFTTPSVILWIILEEGSMFFYSIAGLCALPMILTYGIHRFIWNIKSRVLKNPTIHIEKLLCENIRAFNQRVEMVNLLESGDELLSDEKEEARLKLNILKQDIEQQIDEFRATKKASQKIGKLRKELDGASLKALSANTIEIDVLLEGGIIAREENLIESEQELKTRLQALSAELKT